MAERGLPGNSINAIAYRFVEHAGYCSAEHPGERNRPDLAQIGPSIVV